MWDYIPWGLYFRQMDINTATAVLMGCVLTLYHSSLTSCWPRQNGIPGVNQTLKRMLVTKYSIPTALPVPAQREAPATSI